MTKTENILKKLIGCDTTCTQSNVALVDYIEKTLKENGFITKTFLHPDGKNKSLLAAFGVGQMKDIQDGLLLSGHIDTVGFDPQTWQTNPLTLTEKNARLYGRGTVDMKYFTACFLSLLPLKVQKPLFFCLSCDEETGAQGIRQICAFMKENNIRPKTALVGEPTDFKLCTANKGYMALRTVFTGKSGHSSVPQNGINAISMAGHFICKIDSLNAREMAKGLTLNIGKIAGGTARNCIPEQVVLEWEIRFPKKKDFDRIFKKILSFQKEIQESYPDSQIETTNNFDLPSFEYHSQSTVRKTAEKILKTPEIQLAYATEAGFLQGLGADVLVCGAGESDKLHATDESLKKDDLFRYRDFLKSFIGDLDKNT